MAVQHVTQPTWKAAGSPQCSRSGLLLNKSTVDSCRNLLLEKKLSAAKSPTETTMRNCPTIHQMKLLIGGSYLKSDRKEDRKSLSPAGRIPQCFETNWSCEAHIMRNGNHLTLSTNFTSFFKSLDNNLTNCSDFIIFGSMPGQNFLSEHPDYNHYNALAIHLNGNSGRLWSFWTSRLSETLVGNRDFNMPLDECLNFIANPLLPSDRRLSAASARFLIFKNLQFVNVHTKLYKFLI